jgi:hypothetical protein
LAAVSWVAAVADNDAIARQHFDLFETVTLFVVFDQDVLYRIWIVYQDGIDGPGHWPASADVSVLAYKLLDFGK